MVETGVLCSRGNVIAEAGSNLSVSGLEEVQTNYFIANAEAYISNITQYDWVTNYPGLSTNQRYLLRATAAKMAAIDAINFDTSSLSSREAEVRMSVKDDQIARMIDLLKSDVQNIKDFISGAK